MERDPRTDPRPGDVLDDGGRRIVIIARSHRKVIYRFNDQYTLGAGVGRFTSEHPSATVIRKAEDHG